MGVRSVRDKGQDEVSKIISDLFGRYNETFVEALDLERVVSVLEEMLSHRKHVVITESFKDETTLTLLQSLLVVRNLMRPVEVAKPKAVSRYEKRKEKARSHKKTTRRSK